MKIFSLFTFVLIPNKYLCEMWELIKYILQISELTTWLAFYSSMALEMNRAIQFQLHTGPHVEVLSQEQKVPCDHMLNVWRTTKLRSKKHQTYISLHQPQKSRVAENSSSTSHCIDFRDTWILDITWEYTDRLVQETIEIHLNKNNVNRDCCS